MYSSQWNHSTVIAPPRRLRETINDGLGISSTEYSRKINTHFTSRGYGLPLRSSEAGEVEQRVPQQFWLLVCDYAGFSFLVTVPSQDPRKRNRESTLLTGQGVRGRESLQENVILQPRFPLYQ